jgi:hypothetical protein
MSDALPLLPRPKLDEYEALAKRLRAARQSGDVDDIREWEIFGLIPEWLLR